jgi:hypothetical protein
MYTLDTQPCNTISWYLWNHFHYFHVGRDFSKFSLTNYVKSFEIETAILILIFYEMYPIGDYNNDLII